MTKKSTASPVLEQRHQQLQQQVIAIAQSEKNHNNNNNIGKKRNQSNNVDDSKPLTKRQKYKQQQSSDKHAWPQQPKIQSSEARAKAYLRVAGLGDTTTSAPKEKQQAPLLLLDANSPEMKFGRLLASTNQRIRHTAILQMSQYLKARTDIASASSVVSTTTPDDDECLAAGAGAAGLSELDLLKLWKGIWYCLFLADKVPVQQELSKQIANLLFSVAGTEEEDEYAAHAYLQICGDDDDDDDDDENDDDEEDDDDDSVDMEEIENTLEATDDEDDDDTDDDNQDNNKRHDKRSRQRKEERNDDYEGDDAMYENDEDDEDDEDEMADEEDRREVRHCRGAHLASLFVRTFFHTIRREWGRMDKYRVDKFYTLMRDMMHVIYKYMAIRHWNRGIVRLFNDALYDEVLNQVPNGLRYHIIDIALDEIAKVNATHATIPLTEATFLDCLEPFFAMAQTGAGGSDTVQKRVMEQIVEKFLVQYSVVSDNAILLVAETQKTEGNGTKEDKVNKDNNKNTDNSENKEIYILDDVHVGTIGEFIFEIAADPETLERYRKSLYDMYKNYVRRVKEVGRDVDIDGKQQGDDDDEQNYDYDGEDEKEENGRSKENETTSDDGEGSEEEIEQHKRKSKKTKNRSKGALHGNNETSSKESKSKKTKSKEVISTPPISEEPVLLEHKDKEKKKKKHKRKGSDASDSSKDKIQTGIVKNKKKDSGKANESTDSSIVDKKNEFVSLEKHGSAESMEKTSNRKESSRVKSVTENELKPSPEKSGEEDSGKQHGDPEKKKRKRKKKRKNSDASDSSGNSNQESINPKKDVKHETKDELVTISLTDQKKAKRAMEKKQKGDSPGEEEEKKQKQDNHSNKDGGSKDDKRSSYDSDGNKRVQFGYLNRARSFQASMKNLRTMETPISKTTPDRGILVSKHKMKHQGSKGNKASNNNNNGHSNDNNNKKQKRKKAIDYF